MRAAAPAPPVPVVKVLLPRSLRSYWGGAASVEVEADTVAAAVRALGERWPGLAARIVDEQGKPRRYVHLFVNQDAVHARDLADVKLREGDTLHVLPSVAGGS
jgi:molybdopterin synthase sulfur carrier subunit